MDFTMPGWSLMNLDISDSDNFPRGSHQLPSEFQPELSNYKESRSRRKWIYKRVLDERIQDPALLSERLDRLVCHTLHYSTVPRRRTGAVAMPTMHLGDSAEVHGLSRVAQFIPGRSMTLITPSCLSRNR